MIATPGGDGAAISSRRSASLNVATAGGNIDYWGEYAQRDHAEFSVSQDEWGFVLVEVTAGARKNTVLGAPG